MNSQETKVYIAAVIAGIVLGIILVYFIVSYIRQQRKNYVLYRSKIDAEIITLENERRRFARDVHDEMAPLLNSVKYSINGFTLEDPEEQAILESVNETLDRIIDRSREISGNLMPESLLRNGLVEAIEQSIRKEHARTNLAIQLSHASVPELQREKTINLFRIIQEIISNTIRHAEAKRLAIDIQSTEKTLILVTEDDGRGFDYPAEEKDFSGLGLRNLLSRTEMLNGSMYLETKPGNGTRYKFEIPV